MTLVKVCGMTHTDDVAVCSAAGVDRLGFVIEYPQDVPWNLTRRRAVELMATVPSGIARVAVVGGDAATITAIIDHTAPDRVQLHGDEPVATVAAIARLGVPIIKALRIRTDGPAVAAADVIASAHAYIAAGAAEILLDAATADRPAGTGTAVDWHLAGQVAAAIDVPLILAGGLTPDNVAQAVGQVRPAGVDVISGVEGPGHRKDGARVGSFVQAVRALPH